MVYCYENFSAGLNLQKHFFYLKKDGINGILTIFQMCRISVVLINLLSIKNIFCIFVLHGTEISLKGCDNYRVSHGKVNKVSNLALLRI
jgi:hypothetical protein